MVETHLNSSAARVTVTAGLNPRHLLYMGMWVVPLCKRYVCLHEVFPYIGAWKGQKSSARRSMQKVCKMATSLLRLRPGILLLFSVSVARVHIHVAGGQSRLLCYVLTVVYIDRVGNNFEFDIASIIYINWR
jgi:hypothetical protein